jgi:hypothetical protein
MYHYPEVDYHCSVAEADAHFAHEKGRDYPHICWIVSDRDAVYRNPFYTGPTVPHPDVPYVDDHYAGEATVDHEWDDIPF